MQTWNPEEYARNARFVAELGMPVVDLLAPVAGERILDLGCGDGHLTAVLAARGCDVLGVDSSPAQVEAARKVGLQARVLAAEALDFDAEFDAVFSNATLHWVREADRAIGAVWQALRPGGRFVAELGGEGCVARIRTALSVALARRGLDFAALNPWYFPSAEEYGGKLAAAGFEVEEIVLFARPTPLPGEMRDWLTTFGLSFTGALAPEERVPFLKEVADDLRPELCDSQGHWTADYTRLRFRARKPA